MNDPISRRTVLQGGSAAITLAMLADAFGATVPTGGSAVPVAGVTAMTLLYPAGGFDFDIYRNSYLKVLKGALSRSVERIELRRAIAPQQPPGATAPALPFSAIVNMWISDPHAFLAGLEKHAATLKREAERTTMLVPTVQFDSVHGAMGSARNVPKAGERCLMFLYPNGEGVRWDVDVYRKIQMPLIMELYGTKAISRFEVRKGERGADAGSRPAYAGVVHIYVANVEAMQAAGRQHGQRLMAENQKYSSVDPVVLPSVIEGIV